MKSEQTLEEPLEYSDAGPYAAKAARRDRINRSEQPGPEGGISNVFRVA